MPYDAESDLHLGFVAAVLTYQAALSPAQLADGFADGRQAPPVFDPDHDERSSFAYASWFSQLGEDLSFYAAGGQYPPVPPPLA